MAVVVPTAEPLFGAPRVPLMRPLRPALLPSLKMTAPTAPAASALSALTPKPHVPRCSRAIAPLGKPAKSLVSQPELLLVPSAAPAGDRLRSTATSGAVVCGRD